MPKAVEYGVLWCDRCNGWIETARALCVLIAMICVSLALAPMAIATASPFTWTGAATTPNWSTGKNWEGGAAPTGPAPVALEFPRLSSCINTCYDSSNDMSGLSVESLRIDDGDEYKLEGEEIALGAGGLSASPAAESSGAAGDIFALPITLDAAQTWSIYGRDNIAENGVLVGGGLSGSSSPLNLDIEDEPEVYLASNVEVGPLAVGGIDTGVAGVFNGAVRLLNIELNSQDGNPVGLNHIFLFGSGALGPLTTETAELGAGSSSYPTGKIEATSATFDPASEVIFHVTGAGATPGVDYSQLNSQGQVQLNGASLFVAAGPPSAGASCPTFTPGRRYTLVSTAGTLSGSFGNAPGGSEIPVTFTKACGTREAQELRIEYYASGATQTVTGTVVPPSSGLPLPNQHFNTYEAPDTEALTAGVRSAERLAESAAAERRAKEETEDSLRAATAAKVQNDEVFLAGTSVSVQSDGVALVKLDCAGNVSCAGKLILSATSAAKGKKRRSHTITIGTDGFLLAGGKTTTAHVKLNAAGRKLLANAHQRLAARLEIQKLTPAPEHTLITNVRLTQEPHGKTKR